MVDAIRAGDPIPRNIDQMKMCVFALLVTVSSLVSAQDFKIDFNNLKTNKKEQISVKLHMPDRQPASKPAVIYLSGCDGSITSGGRTVIKKLTALGVLVAELRSLGTGSRFWQNACTAQQGFLTGSQRAEEAYLTKDELVRRGHANENNIGIVGFSHGGWTISYTMFMDDTATYSTKGKTPFSAAVAFYPYCQTNDSETFNLRTPTLMMGGAKDDWTPWERCTHLARMAKLSSTHDHPLEMVLYENASHSWDSEKPFRHVPTHKPEGANLWYDKEASEDSIKRTMDWFEKYLDLK
jgi:dienelactone hydrolase